MTKKQTDGMLYMIECIWKGASLCKGLTFTDASIGIEHPVGLYFQLQKEAPCKQEPSKIRLEADSRESR
jgi:hypothetical protein